MWKCGNVEMWKCEIVTKRKPDETKPLLSLLTE